MIGLDANVLVRYLTQADPGQYTKVRACIEAAIDRGEQLLVSTAVLCELVWVLGSANGYARGEIADAVEQIFATAQFEIERLDEARQALRDFRTTKADFTDALIGRINRAIGATHTVTFDRSLKSIETFRLL